MKIEVNKRERRISIQMRENPFSAKEIVRALHYAKAEEIEKIKKALLVDTATGNNF